MPIAAILFEVDTVWGREGMDEAVAELKAKGYRLALIGRRPPQGPLGEGAAFFEATAFPQPGRPVSPAQAVADAVEEVLEAMKISRQARADVLLVGDDPASHVRAANQLGLISILMHWDDEDDRPEPEDVAELPDFVIGSAGELVLLMARIERFHSDFEGTEDA